MELYLDLNSPMGRKIGPLRDTLEVGDSFYLDDIKYYVLELRKEFGIIVIEEDNYETQD
jgi:hypothetical protein